MNITRVLRRGSSPGSGDAGVTQPGQTDSVKGAPRDAGMSDYLKEAFLFRWNLLFFVGGTAAAALTPFAPVLLPLVAASELTYLAGLVSIPRFRAAIDAKGHAANRPVD